MSGNQDLKCSAGPQETVEKILILSTFQSQLYHFDTRNTNKAEKIILQDKMI